MTKIKKLLLGLSTVTATTLPFFVAAACSGQEEKSKYLTTITLNKSLTKDIQLSRAPKLVVITDEGHVTDKSFNQSSWEALQNIEDQLGDKVEINNIEPQGGKYDEAYESALAEGYNVWVLSGFNQGKPLATYLGVEENRAKLEKAKIRIICIDFVVNPSIYKYVYSLTFKVQEPAWIVGYATAQYLNELYPNNPEKRIASSLGGGAFNGVTDFNNGFLKGLIAWNAANPDKKVKTNSNGVPLSAGFVPNDTMNNVIVQVLSDRPSVVLPVAGPATQETVSKLIADSKFAKSTVIGVDVDQAYSYNENTQEFTRFLTSITKNMGQAVYDVILATEFNLDSKNLFAGNAEKTSATWFKGLSDGWAGYSKSHLADTTMRAKVDGFLTAAKAKYYSLSETEKTKIQEDVDTNGTPYTDLKALMDVLATKVNE